MKITVLVENTSDSDLKSEHGLSLFLEYKGKNYLLDAGQSGLFLENAEKLQIPVETAEYCILSHGHYDHAGGFEEYLRRYPEKKIYAMKSAGENYLSNSGGNLHEIGIPKPILKEHSESFLWIEGVTSLDEGIYLVPHHTQGLEKIGEKAGLFHKVGEVLQPDDFGHEMSLVMETEKGLVIFNSCSHAGVRQILKEVREALPEKTIYAFIGGLHMKGKKDGKEICTFSKEEIHELAEVVKTEKVEKIYTGHCTGSVGFQMLKEELKEGVYPLKTGNIIQLLK